jgi:hypothetical protein
VMNALSCDCRYHMPDSQIEMPSVSFLSLPVTTKEKIRYNT